jgi:hypothetical protein
MDRILPDGEVAIWNFSGSARRGRLATSRHIVGKQGFGTTHSEEGGSNREAHCVVTVADDREWDGGTAPHLAGPDEYSLTHRSSDHNAGRN